MATIADGMVDRTPAIGRVFSRAFSVMTHNPAVTFGTSLLFSALPMVPLTYAMNHWRLEGRLQSSSIVLALIFLGLIAVLMGLVLRALVQGCLVRATVADAEGRRASFGECLGVAANRLLPLIAVSLLFSLAVVVGLILLIIPGILLAVMFAVVVPVTVEERLGVTEAFTRAGDLSEGARWKIFGLALLILISVWLFQAVMGVIAVAIFGSVTPNSLSLPFMLFNMAATTVVTTFWSTMQTALYVELREWKDGPATDRLSEVFE
jgi:hypothetical protein